MIIYWILFTCSLLFLLVSFKGSSTLRKYTLLIFYIAIFLISALRVNIGVDYYGHYLIYNYVEMGEWMVTEPLFALVCSICATLHLGFPCVIAVMSFITIFPLYNVARKSDNLYIFLLFFLILYFIIFVALWCLQLFTTIHIRPLRRRKIPYINCQHVYKLLLQSRSRDCLIFRQ